jgi:GNAT superfamily N-acetyltransferase
MFMDLDTSAAGCNIRPVPAAAERDCTDVVLTLDWATANERQRIVALAAREGRQTMNLRTMPSARLAVLRRPDGRFAGWAGMDADADPQHPEVFSQFVQPAFRGHGLGALLEHVWWAWLAGRGCGTGYMRMELDSNVALVAHRLRSGYCREATPDELGERFMSGCGRCELFGAACHRQIYLAVDIHKALAASTQARGALDLKSFPLAIPVVTARSASLARDGELPCTA